jgi:hypothetical protein
MLTGNGYRMGYLQLQDNQLQGTIPSELGSLFLLSNLNIANNGGISGQIPSEIGLLSQLTYLSLSGTSLTGTVPDEVCMLKSNAQLGDISINCSVVACYCNCTCT